MGVRPHVVVRGRLVSDAAPAVIVPLVGATTDAVVAQARAAVAAGADLVEWRVDAHADGLAPDALAAILVALRDACGDVGVLATLRTSREGGAAEVSDAHYLRLVTALAEAGADAVDVEHLRPTAAAAVRAAHERGVLAVGSQHDFVATPDAAALAASLAAMEDLGCDVAKIAVTPATRADVATLLGACAARADVARVPLIAIAMGSLGAVSRLVGPQFGSCASFATVSASSAPGQVGLEVVREAWQALAAAAHV